MIPTLPAAFVTVPLAHRGYHDRARGRPENSRAAVRAAVAAGYGAEIDVQLSRDGAAMVFHDHDLGRLTGETGPLRQRSAAELGSVALSGGAEGVPTLGETLALVPRRLPLLIEIKDQDGAMGPDVGPLEDAVAAALEGHRGTVAVMSFNPESVAVLADRAPAVPRGLATSAFRAAEWDLPAATRDRLRAIPDADRVGASFISHEARDLDAPRVAELASQGLVVLCWTVRSPAEEAAARRVAHNVTFEGYPAALPA